MTEEEINEKLLLILNEIKLSQEERRQLSMDIVQFRLRQNKLFADLLIVFERLERIEKSLDALKVVK